MSKNKKVVLVSVGILFLLIVSVLFIRDPSASNVPTPDPPKQSVIDTPESPTIPKSPNDDSSQKNIQKLMDDLTAEGLSALPSAWENLKKANSWFMGFDTPYAIVLLIIFILVIALIVPKGKTTK